MSSESLKVLAIVDIWGVMAILHEHLTEHIAALR